jgi:transposase-like protein/transposase
MTSERKTRTAVFKAQVALAAVRGDRTLSELAAHYGVHVTLIHAWKRQLLAGAEAVFGGAKAAGLVESLLQQYRELRALEHQALLFMGRFVLADVPPEGLKGLLSDRLPPNDLDTLFTHANGPSRPRRFRSRTVLFHLCGVPERLIAAFLGVYIRTVKKIILRYRRKGVTALFVPRAGVRKFDDARYKEMVFTVLHAPPKDYGFNRTTWRLRDIRTTMKRLGLPIGKNYIIRIIRDAGYRFLRGCQKTKNGSLATAA